MNVKSVNDVLNVITYSLYNWELFFHVPLLIADRLCKNQRFEEAMKWFHYIFNPMDTSGEGTEPQQHYWQTRPFFERLRTGYVKEKIEELLKNIADPNSPIYQNLITAVQRWRKDPFKPDVVARLRTTAYQKTVMMKYIDNLIAWGDQLFRRDTIESINEATQLYVLAAEILGRRPEILKPRFRPIVQTFNTLISALQSDDFSDPLINAEQIVPVADGGVSTTNPRVWSPGQMLYFGVPKNDKLFGYWDTVADRLFKIRNGLNIEGVARSLALYEPPIDPAMLVRAAAAGLDLGSVLSDLNAPVPHYRFNIIAQKAAELCAEVKALGSALLSALEKRDTEALARLRSTHEMLLLDAVREVKKGQVEEAKENVDGLKESQKVIQARNDYYSTRTYMNQFEMAHLSQMDLSLIAQGAHLGAEILAAIMHLIPNIKFGAPTTIGTTYGGGNIASAAQASGAAASVMAGMLSTSGSMSATLAGYQRRQEEWLHQADLASKELKQIDKQITAAEIRWAIAGKELENHALQIENAKEVDDLMHDKFTNQELYDWMVGQISTVYFQSYQLAYDVAKRAERAYQFELSLEDSNFIQFGYWDSLKKGLLAGERLHHDLKRMEMAYLDQNKREYELTKHVSLNMIDPQALQALKETGECFVELPEALFDMDHPGHYMRRIKSVSLTVPCVAGPYAGVNCTLTLLSNSLRAKATLVKDKYKRDEANDDPRFRDNLVPVQSIATSHCQNDSGIFELNFRDERYLPFEGAGAISSWRIKLPREFRQFDYGTISDVIIHLKYTGREGGEPLRKVAVGEIMNGLEQAASAGLVRLFSIRHEFPTEWARFTGLDATKQSANLSITLRQEHFPFWSKGIVKAVKEANVLAKGNADGIVITETLEDNKVQTELVPFLGEVRKGQLQNRGQVTQKPLSIKFDLVFNSNKMEELWLAVTWSS